MWNAVVLAVLIGVAGVYTTRNLQTVDAGQLNALTASAAEMGSYRAAVVAYFSANNLYSTSVSTATLKAGGYLPSWSRMFQQTAPLRWGNYRDGAGIIYVYSLAVPDRNLVDALLAMSQNSILVSVYDSAHSNLQSPLFGDSGFPAAALVSAVAIPNGAPVWIAMTQ